MDKWPISMWRSEQNSSYGKIQILKNIPFVADQIGRYKLTSNMSDDDPSVLLVRLYIGIILYINIYNIYSDDLQSYF